MISPENYRKGIVEVLQLASSKDAQIAYQREVPIAQVVAEVFCQWEDLYCPETDPFEIAFCFVEREALAEYDRVNSEVAASTHEDQLAGFHETTEFSILQGAAISALASLGIVQ